MRKISAVLLHCARVTLAIHKADTRHFTGEAMRLRIVLFVLAVAFSAAATARATPITFTESATASGSLGGTTFRDALVTLTMSTNTTLVSGGSGFFSVIAPATVTVSGVGSGTFTDSIEVFDNQTFSPTAAAGFGDATLGASILDTFSSVFASYALATAIGPITGSPFINPADTFGTTAGGLNISTAGNSTFTAVTGTAVPEPASMVLLGTGLLGFGARRYRNRRQGK
jgi:hypothetical protein